MKNRTILYVTVALGLLLVAGCSQKTITEKSTSSGVPASGDEGVQVKEVIGEGAQATGEISEFSMTARQWSFSPSTITVNKGDTVKLTVTSTDVAHGFSLPEFGINERLNPGVPVKIEFVADRTGAFTFSCSVPCGSGHGGMKGRLIVK